MTTKAHILRTIALQCQECMGSEKARDFEYSEEHRNIVKDCTAPDCLLFPYRLGRDPKPTRKGNVDSLKKARRAKSRRTNQA